MADLRERLQAAVGDTYSIEKELGGGGMSRVFLADETRLDRKVVIKLLPPEMGAGVNVERFEREIKLAAKLQHPLIVPLLTAGSEGDLLWYVMPYIEGESLRAKLAREGELPIGDAVRILKEVLDALQYAHSHQVVHRDIKPDNVLLSGNHAVVTDFGVAKAVSASTGESSLTSLGVALGTPAYMAPEQAAADPHVDHRADIYAVGALAYEMLTGQPPFTGNTPQAVLSAHITQAPDPVAAHRETVPPALNELIMRCLHKKPADRFQRADEMIPHLDAILTPSGGLTPTGTQPVQAVNYEARVKQAHPVRVAGLYALASIGALAIVYMLMTVIGLPDWVFRGAIGLVAIGLPIMLLTGRRERQVALATMTGMQVATPTGVQRHLTWHKSLIGGGLAFGGLAVVSTTYMAMRVFGIGPAATLVTSGVLDAQERILLADFENATNDSTIGATVTDLLRIDLAQSPIIIVMEPGQVSELLERMQRDPDAPITVDLAREVAAREGMKAYFAGEVRPVGDGYLISARLVSTGTGDALVTGRESAANVQELIPAVDRLSAHFREKIGESLRTVRSDPPLERLTTTSLDALRLYSEASRFADMGDYTRAIAMLEEAVEQDSTFGSAWRRLGAYLGNQGNPGGRGDSAKIRAYELRDRLSYRERYLVEAMHASSIKRDPEKAMTAYLAILERYPTDGTALNNLGLLYSSLGRRADRDDAHWRAMMAGTAMALTYTNYMGSQVTQGNVTALDTALKLFADRFPTSPQVLQWSASLAGMQLEWDEVAAIANEVRSSHPTLGAWAHDRLSDVAQLYGHLDEASREQDQRLRVIAQRQELTPEDRDFRIELQRVERQLEFAEQPSDWLDELEALWQTNVGLTGALGPNLHRYRQFSRAFARAGAADRAQELLDLDLAWRPQTQMETLGFRIGLRRDQAFIAIADGRPDDAVELLRDVRRDTACLWCDLPRLAFAYDQAGNADSALAYYHLYLDTPGFRSAWVWDALTFRRLGELYEARGETDDAVEFYGQLVELWEDADPVLQPIVADVRARIARLVGENR